MEKRGEMNERGVGSFGGAVFYATDLLIYRPIIRAI